MPYNGRIALSPVAQAMTEAGRLALDRAIPDPESALAVAYDWENAPIEVVRSQAAAWGYVPYTGLLGETYERQIMATYGFACEYRNKWIVLDEFFGALNVIYRAEIVGLDDVHYDVDREAGTWGGYDRTRARRLRLHVSLPPGIEVSLDRFVEYITVAVRWLMPYFRDFINVFLTIEDIVARPAVHPTFGTVAMTYLKAVEA